MPSGKFDPFTLDRIWTQFERWICTGDTLTTGALNEMNLETQLHEEGFAMLKVLHTNAQHALWSCVYKFIPICTWTSQLFWAIKSCIHKATENTNLTLTTRRCVITLLWRVKRKQRPCATLYALNLSTGSVLVGFSEKKARRQVTACSRAQIEALTMFTPEKQACVCFTPGLNLCGATICIASYKKEQTYLRKNVNAFKHLTRKTGT